MQVPICVLDPGSRPTKSSIAFCPPSLPNQREGPNKTRQREIKGMDGEIGGIEGLLEGLISGFSRDQMLRDKPSEHIRQPGN